MPRVKKIQEEAPSDWQVVFCSLTIILVAFFVMLCSMATPEQGKMIAISRSFRSAINIFSGGILFDKGDGGGVFVFMARPQPARNNQNIGLHRIIIGVKGRNA